jgi:hypothetical protein
MGHLNLRNIQFMFHHIHVTFKFREFGAAASNYDGRFNDPLFIAHGFNQLQRACCILVTRLESPAKTWLL